MEFEDAEAQPSLPGYTAHLDYTDAGPSSRRPSRTSSEVPARPSSRVSFRGEINGSKSHSSQAERHIYSGRTSKSSLRGEDDEHVIFSMPGDEPDDRNESMTVPLLGIGRGVTDEELDELIHAEGPNTAGRGTMLDGIANMANSIIGAGIVGYQAMSLGYRLRR
ncbi:MAG: hypothetical protein TREMPRED_005612, partial [Tremellales sp. Tagirdzhanova-0007]